MRRRHYRGFSNPTRSAGNKAFSKSWRSSGRLTWEAVCAAPMNVTCCTSVVCGMYEKRPTPRDGLSAKSASSLCSTPAGKGQEGIETSSHNDPDGSPKIRRFYSVIGKVRQLALQHARWEGAPQGSSEIRALTSEV
jgi:hypothetical protein